MFRYKIVHCDDIEDQVCEGIIYATNFIDCVVKLSKTYDDILEMNLEWLGDGCVIELPSNVVDSIANIGDVY